MIRTPTSLLVATAALAAAAALAQPQPPARDPAPGLPVQGEAIRLTGPVPMTETVPAPPIPPDVVDDRRKMRNYPDQPPVIPHSIRGYQIDLNTNRCLTCHSRQYTEQSQAPMISVTHYQDREGQFLAQVSPRRYFCTGCHVTQTMAQPLVGNTFVDMDVLVGPSRRREGE